MPSIKLTQAEVNRLQPHATKQLLYRDTETPGLALRITPGGRKTYVFNYSLFGRERRMRISDAATCKVAEAREAAKKLRRDVDQGIDPLEKRESAAKSPTVKTLWVDFQADHFPTISDRHRAEQVKYWDRHVLPALGNKKLSALAKRDIDELHRRISVTAPILANRVVASVRKALSYAEGRDWVQKNVAMKVRQNREKSRKRYLSPAELNRVVKALTSMKNRQAAGAITLLLLTGARRSEVFGAKWDEFDIPPEGTEGPAQWHKPADRVKSRVDVSVKLSPTAVDLIRKIRSEQDPPSPYLFPSRTGEPIQDIKKPWAWLLREAGLTDFRIHDLRHTYASLLISNGQSLAAVGEMLGHSQPQTTSRYAHLMDDQQQAAANLVGDIWRKAAKGAEADLG